MRLEARPFMFYERLVRENAVVQWDDSPMDVDITHSFSSEEKTAQEKEKECFRIDDSSLLRDLPENALAMAFAIIEGNDRIFKETIWKRGGVLPIHWELACSHGRVEMARVLFDVVSKPIVLEKGWEEVWSQEICSLIREKSHISGVFSEFHQIIFED